jgi:hypothetical protein
MWLKARSGAISNYVALGTEAFEKALKRQLAGSVP